MVTTNKTNFLEQFASGAAISIVWAVVGFGSAFLFKLFAARYFGPHDFGVYSLLETVFGLVLLFGILGIPHGIPRYFASYLEQKKYSFLRGYWIFSSQLLIISGIVFGFLLILFASPITAFFNFPLEFTRYVQFLGLVIPFAVLNKLFEALLIAHRKIGASKFSSVAFDKIIYLFGFVFIWFLHLSFWWFIFLFIIGKFVPFIYTLIRSRPFIPSHKYKPLYEKHSWLYFSLPLLFSTFFGYIFFWIDNIVVGKVLGPTELGIYSVVFSLAFLLTFFQNSIGFIFINIGAEKYAKKLKSDLSLLFSKEITWVFGLTLPLFIVLVLFSKEILSLLYGSAFSSGHFALVILAFGFLINISCGFGGQILLLHKKTKSILGINIVFASLNLILNLFLVPLYGISGAGFATATSIILQQLTLFFLARQYETLVIEWVYLTKFLFAGVLATGGIFLSKYLFNSLWLILTVGLVSFILFYFFFVLLFRTLKKDDFEILLFFEKKLGFSLKKIKNLVKKISGF